MENCLNECIYDSDGDGVCDEIEVIGCMDQFACNYNANATDDDVCIYPELYYDCNGVCLSDSDGDGVCYELEIYGCTDPQACNYNDIATEEDNSCIYAIGCDYCSGDTDGTGFVIDGDVDQDGICDDNEIFGCTDSSACNYDSEATDDDGSCEYPTIWYLDLDGDGDGNSDDGEILSCDQPDGYVNNNNDNVSYPYGSGSCCRGDNINLDESALIDFKLYPNPATSVLNIN